MHHRGTSWLNVVLSAALLMACGESSDDDNGVGNNSALDGSAGAAGGTAEAGPTPTSRPCGGGIACEQGTVCGWDTGGDVAVDCVCGSSKLFACKSYSTLPDVSDPGSSTNEQMDCSAGNCGGFASCYFEAECQVLVNCVSKTESIACKDAGGGSQ